MTFKLASLLLPESLVVKFYLVNFFILFFFLVFASVSAVLSGKSLNTCGDCVDLENKCKNLMELDISNNLFSDWNEVNFFSFLLYRK